MKKMQKLEKVRWLALPLASLLLSPLSAHAEVNGEALKVADVQGTASQKTVKVSGTVVDATGEPIIGATIIEKGTKNATVTDFDGKFTVGVSKIGVPITVSYVGYKSQNVTTTSTAINIVLQEDASQLEDVVVIGYGTMKKKDLTGAIAQIDPTKNDSKFTANAVDLLRNSISGMSMPISNSAKGDIKTADIQLRGQNSIKASNGPLIVLDGIIWDGDLADISSSDIERIDVMKDASSAAVYGSRAANGVIQITTKRGHNGAPTITASANWGVQAAANLRDACNGKQYIDMRQKVYQTVRGVSEEKGGKRFYEDPRALDQEGRREWMKWNLTPAQLNDPEFIANLDLSDGAVATQWLSRLNFYPVEIKNYLDPNFKETDWRDLVYHTGFKQDYNMNVSGGSERSKYYFSLGYSNVEGYVRGDEYEAIRSRLNVETDLNKWLTVGASGNFAVRNEGSIAVGTGYDQMSPYATPYDEDGNLKQYPMDNGGQDGGSNPLIANAWSNDYNKTLDLNTKVFGTINFPYGFKYTLNIVNDFSQNRHYRHDPAATPGRNDGGNAYRHNTSAWNWTVENLLKWSKTFGVHAFDVTLMQNAEKRQSWYDKIDAQKFLPTDILGYHAIELGQNVQVGSNDWVETREAQLARLNYTLMDRYYFTAAVRRDGFSAFGADSRHATFPTVALGWRISDEDFMKSTNSWLDNLKLRLSWGDNGNSAVGRYDALALMQINKTLLANPDGSYYTATGLNLYRLANSALQWEKTTSTNFGFDFSVFGGRLSGSIDYYFSKTKDLLLDRQLPAVMGVKSVASNIGQVNNNGFDISLNSLNVSIKDKLDWRTSLTLSGYRNRIKHLYGDLDENGNEVDDTKNGWFIGHSIDAIYDYKPNGVWQAGELAAIREEQPNAFPGYVDGDYKMVDKNGDNNYTADEDRYFLGHKNPHFFFNMTNQFTILNDIDFSFTIYGMTGYKANQLEYFGRTTLNSYADTKYWTPENASNEYPRIVERTIDRVPQSHYVRRDFLRLSNISLSYNLKKEWIKPLGLTSAKVFATVDNVCVLTAWEYTDPENMGLVPRKFNFGLNVKF